MAAAFHVALFQRVEDQFGILDEEIAALVLIEAEALVLDSRETAADAENEAAVGEMVEQRGLLGDPNRIVPGQHHHHRAELHVLGLARHVGQELQHVGAHRVVVEVMLDRPDRVESERLGHLGKPQFVAIDLGVGKCVVGILESCSVAYVHGILLM